MIAELAAAYPAKFIWGSNSPFYSYAASINNQVVRLISAYGREVEVRRANPPAVVDRIANQNIRDYLRLKGENILP